MSIELMLDSINIITEKSQSSIEQIVRKDKPMSEKLKFISLNLNEMKSEIYEWICGVLNFSKDIKETINKLSEMKKSTDEELTKHRLHILLKKKLKNLKKQSFLHSIDSHDNFFQDESKIHDLEKSLLHIEKDLNIEPQEDDRFAISSIIQKSRMLNIDHSAVKDQHNISTVSEYEVFTMDLSVKREENQRNFIDSAQLLTRIQAKTLQISDFLQEKNEVDTQKIDMKENEQRNIPEIIQGEKSFKMQKSPSKDKKLSETDKSVQLVKIMKKKKKSVYSTTGQSASLSKDDLLGNILEECLENENM